MTRKKKLWYAGAGLAIGAALVGHQILRWAPNVIRGAVITSDPDPARQLPIGGVEVSILSRLSSSTAHSEASGLFAVPLPWHLRRGRRVSVRFSHPDYMPLDLSCVAGDQICIARLVPLARPKAPPSPNPEVALANGVSLSNVVVKYSIITKTAVNVGSAVKTFQVVNKGNVPCKSHYPCSPDGKWKAQEGSAEIDAGPGNEFRNARASCIAGPCPFTRITGQGVSLSSDGRKAKVTVLDWSDTTTFLFEAEVYKPIVDNMLRQSYPLIFERALTFTLPGAAEGVSIQAELNGQMVIFPLGPSLFLSWADCQTVVNNDNTKVYRCELKPGYRFFKPTPNSAGS